MGLPRYYRRVGESSIVSYDFQDILSGTAYDTFYLTVTNEDGSSSNFLTNFVFESYSKEKVTSVDGSGYPNFTKLGDYDFDLQVNLPTTLKGTGIISFRAVSVGTAGAALDYYFKIRLRKYDGSTETEIANVDTENVNGNTEKYYAAQLDIPKTVYSIGETIRVTVEVWARLPGSSGTANIYFGTDPEGNAGGNLSDTGDTIFKLLLPFEVQR